MREKKKIFAVSAIVSVAVSVMGLSPIAAGAEKVLNYDNQLTPIKAEKVETNTNAYNVENSDNDVYSSTFIHPIKAKAPKQKHKPLQVRYTLPKNSTTDSKDNNDSSSEKDNFVMEEHMVFDTSGLNKDEIKWILTAAQLSKQKIPAGFFRAIAEQESNINPKAFAMDRNGGTWSIWQINEYHVGRFYDGGNFETDRNDNGTPDVQEPLIAAKIAAAYFDDLYLQLEQMRKDYADERWAKELTVWEAMAVAHNAGPTGMRKYPNFAVPEITDKYLRNMSVKIPLYMMKDED